IEPGVARDVQRLLADLIDTAPDHIVNLGRVDPGALDQTFQRKAEHFDGVPGAELATPLAEGGAQGANDDRVPRAVSVLAVTVVHRNLRLPGGMLLASSA